LFVGNKQRSKGVEDLLNAFALLLRDPALTGCRLSIICVGVKPSVGPYAWLVSRYQLGAYLTEISEVPHEQVFDYYRASDVLVLPSRVTPLWQEQFGMVLAEAMGNGLPVVSTHSGSISEVTEDAALYARPNDHHSLYCALKRLALDDGLRARLSAAGAARAQIYEISRVANRLASVYREVLEAARYATQ
jgi:glycosyltransferase involved in cell wall biosynthesis